MNNKLKQDYLTNRAKLMNGFVPNTQVKRYTSVEHKQ